MALCPFFAVGGNPLRAVFLEPEMRSFSPQWDDATVKSGSGSTPGLGTEVKTAGTYGYVCTVHPDMTAQIV